MCKSIHLVTICPVCFDPNPAHAGDNGQHFETILCPEAFHTKQACELAPDNNAKQDDRISTNLPHAQYNKLAKDMCDQCGPFFKESSASMSTGIAHYPSVDASPFLPSTDAGAVAAAMYEDILRGTISARTLNPFDPRFAAADPMEGPNPNRRMRRNQVCQKGLTTASLLPVFPPTTTTIAAATKTNTGPGLAEFMKIATKAGWTASDPLGANLKQATKSQITEEFLKLADAHHQAARGPCPGYDWSKDPFLKAHHPRIIAKLIELQKDPDSVLNKPGSEVMAGPDFIAVTDRTSGETTMIDCSRPKGPAGSSTMGTRKCNTAAGIRWRRDQLNQADNDTGDICEKPGSPLEESPPKEPVKTTKIRDSPNKVVKNTKAKNKTPTKKNAEGKVTKNVSPKKGDPSPKKVTVSPKKDAAKTKAKPKVAGKGKSIEERIEGEATPSPSGRSLRKR